MSMQLKVKAKQNLGVFYARKLDYKSDVEVIEYSHDIILNYNMEN
jgi:hypothetical protein